MPDLLLDPDTASAVQLGLKSRRPSIRVIRYEECLPPSPWQMRDPVPGKSTSARVLARPR